MIQKLSRGLQKNAKGVFGVEQNKDDFWNISDLIPKKRAHSYAAPRYQSTEPVEIGVPAPAQQPSATAWEDLPLAVRYVNPPEQKKTADESYAPANSLITKVEIHRRKNEQSYYEQFASMAVELQDREGEECDPVPFFSYMPQYTQLNEGQLAYYLWWRTSFRRGRALPADFSYLLLYLYEQINLSLYRDPLEGRDNIVRLWLSYGKENPRIGSLVREWLCDYSLLHRLPPPRFSPTQYRALLGGFRLKEFYIPADPSGDFLASALLLFCNNYDYTKSKYYNEETKEHFERVLGGCVRVALDFLREQGSGLLTGKAGLSTMTRDCFAGAICSYRLKCRLEVSYTSFSGTHELRFIITDVLKYAENALRGALGIRSRLSIYAVSASMRARLDDYLRTALPEKRRRTGGEKTAKPVEIPAYERRYDLPVTTISPERAAEIEAQSWATTKRLVEAFIPEDGAQKAEQEKPYTQPQDKVEVPVSELAQNEEKALNGTEKSDVLTPCAEEGGASSSSFAPFGALLQAILAGDRAKQREVARARGAMVDALVDEINTVAGDIIGDILILEGGTGYEIVEDYLELLKQEGVL